jgi:hypothetical protein
MLYMSMFRCHKTFNVKLVKKQSYFFSQEGGTVRKYHLVKWDFIARSKEKRRFRYKRLKK